MVPAQGPGSAPAQEEDRVPGRAVQDRSSYCLICIADGLRNFSRTFRSDRPLEHQEATSPSGAFVCLRGFFLVLALRRRRHGRMKRHHARVLTPEREPADQSI